MKPQLYPTSPAHLWEHFYQITQIPRPSRQEDAVRRYVIDCAEQQGCEWQMDGVGNVVVRVPASAGRENQPTVIVQNHLDMVTVKTDDKVHDFSRDPLALKVEDGWLLADRTTLGADNGVGCAAALAAMTDAEVERPPLELLFTVDEETGLGGALGLDSSMLTGSLMLNLDTEDWHELYIGCAGGAGWCFRREFEAALPEGNAWRLSLKGLAGGHSGIQIHEQLGNAIKLVSQCLSSFDGLRLAAFDAGVAHNVIPREAQAVFSCDPGQDLHAIIDVLASQARSYLPEADRDMTWLLEEVPALPALSEPDSQAVLDIVAAMPHGAQAYSFAQPADLVDLSINLAVLRLEAGSLFIESSYRYFNRGQAEPLIQSVESLARAFELQVEADAGYPGWEPDFSGKLLAQGKALHKELFGFEPEVKAIHAGLECGILKSKKPDVDILSFGPTIRGAHSPTERLQIDTVEPFWRYFKATLAAI
ncbi:MAG: beta-Ala-His dipeptidase [Pseudomonadota bacterium]